MAAPANPRVFFDITLGGRAAGRIEMTVRARLRRVFVVRLNCRRLGFGFFTSRLALLKAKAIASRYGELHHCVFVFFFSNICSRQFAFSRHSWAPRHRQTTVLSWQALVRNASGAAALIVFHVDLLFCFAAACGHRAEDCGELPPAVHGRGWRWPRGQEAALQGHKSALLTHDCTIMLLSLFV